jgi:DnaJ-domain-containing protein 1
VESPPPATHLFGLGQGLILVLVIFVLVRFLKSQEPESRFKERAHRKPRAPKAKVLLQGVVLTGLPHQVLGVREDATEWEIRKAHRTLIKRFHPDKVGREGSREWYEAQRASEAINGARDSMLKKLKS